MLSTSVISYCPSVGLKACTRAGVAVTGARHKVRLQASLVIYTTVPPVNTLMSIRLPVPRSTSVCP